MHIALGVNAMLVQTGSGLGKEVKKWVDGVETCNACAKDDGLSGYFALLRQVKTRMGGWDLGIGEVGAKGFELGGHWMRCPGDERSERVKCGRKGVSHGVEGKRQR